MIKRVALLLCSAAPVIAPAADYPARPLRILTPFSAGSTTDIIARPIAARLTELWGQPVVVDNRAGAGGNVAAEIVAHGVPDGHTLLVTSPGPVVINPSLYASLPYDPARELAPVTLIAAGANVLAVHPAVAANSVQQLIALARSRPDALNYASSGIGTIPHLSGELFRIAAKLPVIHVAYKGGPEAITDALANRINFVFSPIGLALPLVKDKRLLALAVSPATRSPALPDVPTVAEAGVPGFALDTWYGLFAPAQTPRHVLHQISAEVARMLKLPDVKERYDLRGAVPRPSTPEEFNKFVKSEYDKLAAIVKAAGVKPE